MPQHLCMKHIFLIRLHIVCALGAINSNEFQCTNEMLKQQQQHTIKNESTFCQLSLLCSVFCSVIKSQNVHCYVGASYIYVRPKRSKEYSRNERQKQKRNMSINAEILQNIAFLFLKCNLQFYDQQICQTMQTLLLAEFLRFVLAFKAFQRNIHTLFLLFCSLFNQRFALSCLYFVVSVSFFPFHLLSFAPFLSLAPLSLSPRFSLSISHSPLSHTKLPLLPSIAHHRNQSQPINSTVRVHVNCTCS